LIVHDHRSASIAAAGALALGISLLSVSPATADDVTAEPVPVPSAATYVADPAVPATVDPGPSNTVSSVDLTLTVDDRTFFISTKRETVGQFLLDRNIRVSQDDFVSAPLDAQITGAMHLSYRSSKLITIIVGPQKHVVHSAAATVSDVLREQHISIGARDDVSPSLDDQPLNADVIRVSRDAVWTVHARSAIAAGYSERNDPKLALGTSRTVDPGRAGLRETTTRVSRKSDGRVVRTLLASRIVRAPRARVIERGIAAYSSLASVAQAGFTSALHFAGNAIRMIATAYTAGCYGCSGLTASGARAGFGIIAVDPNVIPLGTRLFIPGYGRAVAGDTGGAIRGHRIDLGMNSVADAMRFGRRPITVYVLR
jgi:3D (Asp-Asp-Asp) domain-containing protein